MTLTQREAQPPTCSSPAGCTRANLRESGYSHHYSPVPTMFRFLLSFLIGKFIGDFIFGALLRSKLLRRLTVVAIIGTYVWAKYW